MKALHSECLFLFQVRTASGVDSPRSWGSPLRGSSCVAVLIRSRRISGHHLMKARHSECLFLCQVRTAAGVDSPRSWGSPLRGSSFLLVPLLLVPGSGSPVGVALKIAASAAEQEPRSKLECQCNFERLIHWQ